MTKNKADRFAEALTDLCQAHGIMIWTTFPASPIMMTDVGEDVAFSYKAIGQNRSDYELERVLQIR